MREKQKNFKDSSTISMLNGVSFTQSMLNDQSHHNFAFRL